MKHIEKIKCAEAWLANGYPGPATFLGLDLTMFDDTMAAFDLRGSAFLGCTIGPRLSRAIYEQRAILITELPGLPPRLPPFLRGIYSVPELYDGLAKDGSGWENTPDYKGFEFFMDINAKVPKRLTLADKIAARLHDTVQEKAVADFLVDRDVVAIMGGHDFRRRLSDDDRAANKPDVYWECVAIAKALTEEGFRIITGGGPGLMEAGNLGALLAFASDDLVAQVKALLVTPPEPTFTDKEWRATAMAARDLILGDWHNDAKPEQFSLGIPTWLYGHEPPNFFASHHSKMFFNSLREDGLVTLANKGIIFFEGNSGTIQEVFQDLNQNYYRARQETATPMIFYNTNGYWDRACTDVSLAGATTNDKRKPLMPLVRQLAAENGFTDAVLVTASPHETVEFIKRARNDQKVRKADAALGNAVT